MKKVTETFIWKLFIEKWEEATLYEKYIVNDTTIIMDQ